MRAHWCRRCENQLTAALVPAVREQVLLQSHWRGNQHCYSRTGAGGARTSTVTVALVREPALLHSHWCENQHCYTRTGARTSTATVVLVRDSALLHSHWCENQHHCRTVLVFALASCHRYSEGCTDINARNQCETGSNGNARKKKQKL